MNPERSTKTNVRGTRIAFSLPTAAPKCLQAFARAATPRGRNRRVARGEVDGALDGHPAGGGTLAPMGSRFTYSRWDGTQVGFDLDADSVLSTRSPTTCCTTAT